MPISDDWPSFLTVVGLVVTFTLAGARLRARYLSPTALVASFVVYALLLFAPANPSRLWSDGEKTLTSLTASIEDWWRHPAETSRRVNVPRAGEREALPPQVIAMVNILARQGLEEYDLSPGMRANDWVLLQTVASAWPRRQKDGFLAVFVAEGESVSPDCVVLDREEGVRLVRCR